MNNIESSTGEIVMYQPDETIRLEVRMGEETVWLTQQQMATLFQRDQSVIARHIRNIYKEEELDEEGTYAKFAYMGHLPPVEGIFFDGQIFDAYVQIVSLIKQAKSSIILIDNYIDETTLTMLSKRDANVSATIYSCQISNSLTLSDIISNTRPSKSTSVSEITIAS